MPPPVYRMFIHAMPQCARRRPTLSQGHAAMISRRTLLLSSASLAAGLSATRARAQPAARTLRMTYLFAKDSQLGAGVTAMAAEVEKRTLGRIRIEHAPDGTLGGDVEMLKGVQLGSIDLAFVTGAGLPSILPETDVVHIPFLFRDVEHARAAFDGAAGQDMLKRIATKDLVPLAWGENGMRHMTNSRHPITAPEDLKGLKMRLPQSDVMVLGFKALGAETGMLPFPQLYEALQNGQFDGQENPIATIRASKLEKVQKFLTLSGHVYDPAIIVMAPDAYADLSAEEKAIFADAAKSGAQASRRYADQAEQSGVSARSASARMRSPASTPSPEPSRPCPRTIASRVCSACRSGRASSPASPWS
jgi:tripartite ATP-independent transporter DctP family solute receptor